MPTPKSHKIDVLPPHIQAAIDNVEVTPAWKMFIWLAENVFTYGQVMLEIADGQPGKVLEGMRTLRCDRPMTIARLIALVQACSQPRG